LENRGSSTAKPWETGTFLTDNFVAQKTFAAADFHFHQLARDCFRQKITGKSGQCRRFFAAENCRTKRDVDFINKIER
jgi:hypothetical protein